MFSDPTGEDQQIDPTLLLNHLVRMQEL
jgi:hypothetical protein